MSTPTRSAEFYIISLIVAFCSLIYEFIIAQTLAAVLGGTLLCYALVIGGFTLAMGMGALHVDYLSARQQDVPQFSWRHFLHIEILLTLVGSFGPWWVLLMDPVQWPSALAWPVRVFAFLPCLIIGWYTGKELPLLMQLSQDHKRGLRVMAFDYLGMFSASLLFPLLLLPHFGIWRTSLLTALLNAIAAGWVMWRGNSPQGWRWVQSVFVFLLLLAWSQHQRLENFATGWFTGV